MQPNAEIADFIRRNGLVIDMIEVEGVNIRPNYPQKHFRVWLESEFHSFDTDYKTLWDSPKSSFTPEGVLKSFAFVCSTAEGRDFATWCSEKQYQNPAVALEHFESGQRLCDNMKKLISPDEWGAFLSIAPKV